MDKNHFEESVISELRKIQTMLVSKNTAYGNAALEPINIFSQNTPVEAICSRIDDKLSRIKNQGINDLSEDSVSDLIGYLVLLKLSLSKNKVENYSKINYAYTIIDERGY